MAGDYTRYLAENVLNERRTVTHRSLSRALKVHSNLAKQMLYEFHRSENAKRPNSVNATYVIAGIPRRPEDKPETNGHHAKKDEDEIMQSSPYISSSMPQQDAVQEQVKTASIVLAREEDLADAKSTFHSISSIHVYSLQPTVLQDLNVLTDVSREITVTYANEDPLEDGSKWGMIQNKNVKRRTGVRPPPPTAAQPSKASPSASSLPAKRPLQTEAKNEEDTDSKPQIDVSQSSVKSKGKTAPLKREKSNIFRSFAKAKPKQTTEASATPAVSAAESAEPSGAEDVVLDDASEEEPEELFPDTGKQTSNATRESRKEREERLKKMMEDDDDEDMPDAAETPEESAPLEPPKEPEMKEQVTVQGGRRRGRRQVMKKKTVKDEEGYLVTVEEPVWESFSEDEVAVPPPKKKPAVSAAKGKAGPKAGQGSIMSFFSKK